MSWQPQLGFPAFLNAEWSLLAAGWRVFNPAAHDIEVYGWAMFRDNHTGDPSLLNGFDLRAALAWDTDRILESDAIYMLKGWEHSTGANTEWSLARAVKLEFIYE